MTDEGCERPVASSGAWAAASARLIRLLENRVPKYVPDSSELHRTPRLEMCRNVPKSPETGLPDRILSPETRVRIPVAVLRETSQDGVFLRW
jgi:hypothetical protein